MSPSAARATSSPNGSRRAVPAGDSYKHFETSTMDAWDPRGLDDDLALLSLDPKRTKQKSQPGRPNPQSHNELKPPSSNSSAQAIQSSSELSSASSRYPLPSSPLTHSARNSLPASTSASDSESTVRLARADLTLSAVSPNKSVLFSSPQSSAAAAPATTVHSLSSFANLDHLESLTIGQNTFNLNASSVVHMPTAQRLALTVLENHRKLQQREKHPSGTSAAPADSPIGAGPGAGAGAHPTPNSNAEPAAEEASLAHSHMPGQCVRLERARPAAMAFAAATVRANAGSCSSALPERPQAAASAANGAGARTQAAALPFARWQQPTPRETSRMEKFEALLFRSGLIDIGT